VRIGRRQAGTAVGENQADAWPSVAPIETSSSASQSLEGFRPGCAKEASKCRLPSRRIPYATSICTCLRPAGRRTRRLTPSERDRHSRHSTAPDETGVTASSRSRVSSIRLCATVSPVMVATTRPTCRVLMPRKTLPDQQRTSRPALKSPQPHRRGSCPGCAQCATESSRTESRNSLVVAIR